jgi:predicted transcriptional regulator
VEDCGICDVCRDKYDGDDLDFPSITEGILALLKEKSRTSRVLIQMLNHKESHILKTIRSLLEDGQIRVNPKNEYEIPKK